MSEDVINDQVRALTRLGLDGLRAEWRRLYGSPPTTKSIELLRRMLSWRIQVEAFGGLDVETRRRLRRDAPVRPLAPAPSPGSRLTREWQGVAETVEIAGDGFIHRGQRYASLSQVARAITGVRWNGPQFFGLRTGKDAG